MAALTVWLTDDCCPLCRSLLRQRDQADGLVSQGVRLRLVGDLAGRPGRRSAVTETQMIGMTTIRATRADRMAMPMARDVLRDVAIENGACIRPIQLRRTDRDTGQSETVLVPCGSTLESVCPPCAERAKVLRAGQCREGWHLEDEPGITPGPATEDQRWWITMRAEAERDRDQAAQVVQDTADFDELIAALDAEITKAGIRGKAAPARAKRRHRSTRRRQDAPDVPKHKVNARTVGKTYTAPDGKTFRPSLFVTLTCPSYGPVRQDGTPADPEAYDYDRAARDALHFAALFDRFIQNLRRYLGYDVQYFATVEPQKRLAPHVHIVMRGTVARAEIRRVLAATYHQVWWPTATEVKFDGEQLPVWDEHVPGYLDPATGEVLPTWDQALDAIGKDDQPHRVARFGSRFDAQGVARGLEGRGAVHRVPNQVPDQASRPLPPRADPRRAGSRGRAGKGAAVPAVLADLRELAALRRSAQERPGRPGARLLQGQGPRL
jgi:Helitron helicase-like domain at N-terminus